MAYKYDVLISFKINDENKEWIMKFSKKLLNKLKDDLSDINANVFVSPESIGNGELWRRELEEGIRSSKTALCFWSPLYFKSRWCLSELLAFEIREKDNKRGPLIQTVFSHNNNTIKCLTERRNVLVDFTEFITDNTSFWNSPKALALDDEIRKLSQSLTHMINYSPAFDDNFKVIFCCDESEYYKELIKNDLIDFESHRRFLINGVLNKEFYETAVNDNILDKEIYKKLHDEGAFNYNTTNKSNRIKL